ncbi:TPA: ROK family protein [Candidatus Woesearchaeota archaeon]|nr:ROK family protein [Candidatus Woesearchaeota archaeon]
MNAIAIDFGGTKIEGSIVTDKGKIIKTVRHPTEAAKGKKTVVDNVVGVIEQLKKDKAGKTVKGVGISMPGLIKDGVVIWGGGTLTCLDGLKFAALLKKKTGLDTYIENDANCFALAEAVFGAGKNHGVVVGVIWGTGVGGGIVVDKKVFDGAYGGAGEFGHMVMDHNVRSGPACGCGQKACLEMVSSGKNIERIYKERGGKIKGATVPQIYASKEPVARDTIKNAAYFMGLGLSYLVNTLNPDVIVLGGGVSKLPDDVYDVVRASTRHFALKQLTKRLKIVRHKISDSAGTLGAAALVFEAR